MGTGLPLLESCDTRKPYTLRIIHTSDFHSSFQFGPSRGRANGPGWSAFRSTIEGLKSEADGYLLFDSGDFAGGSFFHRMFEGVPECEALSELGYDAITLGESDLSLGMQPWRKCKSIKGFDLICSNYDLRLTPLGEWAVPFRVYVRDNLRIGVYALGRELVGSVSRENREEIVYTPPAESALYWEEQLKNRMSCDLIICLSHLGFSYSRPEEPSDLQLAGMLKHTDAILGGHLHDSLEEPIVINNSHNRRVIISQAGKFGQKVGAIDFHYAWVEGLERKPTAWDIRSV